MPFLKFSNADISFVEKILTWKFYTTKKVLLITKWVQLIDPKKFVIVALDAGSETFVVHVAIREREKMPVHAERQALIEAEAHINA